MKHTFLLLAVACLPCVPGTTFAAIVYSGSQNVTVALDGSASPPPMSVGIDIADSPSSWDDFGVYLWYEGPPPTSMTMDLPDTYLTLRGGAPGSMSVGDVGRVVEYLSAPMGEGGMAVSGLALNLAAGEPIGPDSPLVDPALDPLLSHGSDGGTILGQFDESGGYIGLAMPGPTDYYYGWLHMAGMSNIGLANMSVTFDGWAYEDIEGQAITACDTGVGAVVPAPGALVLAGIGVGLLAGKRRLKS